MRNNIACHLIIIIAHTVASYNNPSIGRGVSFPEKSFFKSLQIEVSSTKHGWFLQLRSFRVPGSHSFGFDPFCDQETVQNELILKRCADQNIDLPEKEEGLSMTVINERNGTVALQKVFRTWEFWTHWANLLWYLENVPSGRIVVFSFSGVGSIGLRHAVPTLSSMGSQMAAYLTQKNNWIWVFIKNGRTVYEASSLKEYPSIHANLNLSFLTIPKPIIVSWTDKLRWEICRSNELMGEFCEENSINSYYNIKPSLNVTFNVLKNVPIVVTAGSRPHYFYFAIRKLLETPGVNRDQIIVILGGKHQVYLDLLKLLNLKYIVLSLYWEGNAKLFQYYRRVYWYVSVTYPNSPAAIFMDEDVEVSPDFFFYMNQTLPYLLKDKSLYCLNSYSSVRSNQLAHDSTIVLRSVAQVAWGYAVTLEFINEALLQWPRDNRENLFDMWLLLNVSNGRECIFPEQTRTKHFGIDGVNFEATFTSESYSVFLPLLMSYGVKLKNLDKMDLQEWRKEMIKDIKTSKVLTGNPCTSNFLPKYEEGTFVSYFILENITEEYLGNFMLAGTCLGIWSMSYQGLHDGMFTLRPRHDTLLHMIGVPASNYSNLMPPNVKPWDFNALSNEEKGAVLNYKERLAVNEIELYEGISNKISEAVSDLFNYNFNKSNSRTNSSLR